jgi:hypothetical protein
MPFALDEDQRAIQAMAHDTPLKRAVRRPRIGLALKATDPSVLIIVAREMFR